MAPRPTITIGVIGTGWIVRAHLYALQTLNVLAPLPARIRIKWIYGRKESSASSAAAELGVERWTTDWREIVEDPEVDVVANLASNVLHPPATLAALASGKHVLCEKPLAEDLRDARAMAEAAEAAGVLAATGFNYRYVPAVRMIRQLRDSGQLGDVRHYRGLYLQDWASRGGTWTGEQSRSEALLVIHIFDLLRHLGGEPQSVMATAAKFVGDHDDALAASFALEGGAMGTIEASSCATGWVGRNRVEINGTLGSAWWDMEDFSRLHVMFTKDRSAGLGGFREVVVSEPDHPFMDIWWNTGHVVGWQSTMVHQWRAFLKAVIDGTPLEPLQATFADGYRAGELAEAALRSAALGTRVSCDPGLS